MKRPTDGDWRRGGRGHCLATSLALVLTSPLWLPVLAVAAMFVGRGPR